MKELVSKVPNLETGAKKVDKLKIVPIQRNLQLLSNQAQIQATLGTHKLSRCFFCFIRTCGFFSDSKSLSQSFFCSSLCFA